jgi:hypothetical protein
MTGARPNSARLAAWAAAAALSVAGSAAHAEGEHALASSRIHKLEVVAEGGAAWCQPTVRLRMLLDAGSPDSGKVASQIAVMNVLKGPIATGCTIAAAAELTVVDNGVTTGAFKAQAATGWIFSAVAPSPVPGAAAPSPGAGAPPAPQPAQPAPPVAAVDAPKPLPREMNYPGALVSLIQSDPSLADDDGILRWWAWHRFPNDYNQNANQEFRLQSVLQRARSDLAATVAQADHGHVTAVLGGVFGPYDFKRQLFPIDLQMNQIGMSKPCCMSFPNLPDSFVIHVSGADAVNALPMSPAMAETFTDRRTRFGNVDRSIAIAFTIDIGPQGFRRTGPGPATAEGRIESATIFADRQATQVLYQIPASEIARIRAERAAEAEAKAKAEAARQAAERRRQMLAERDQDVQMLGNSPDGVRLANWFSTGPLNFAARLDDLRSARYAALVRNAAVPVTMLVQAGSAGRSHVDTTWPGHLLVSVPDGQPDLSASNWYLVQGVLSVSDETTLPPAELTAQRVYACKQSQCAEAKDAAATVDRKLAAADGTR